MSSGKEFLMATRTFYASSDMGCGGGASERGYSADVPLAAYIKILNPEGPQPSKHLQEIFKSAVVKLDDWMADHLDILTQGNNPLYTRLYTAEEISDLQESYSHRLKQVAEAHPHTHPVIACPMMGAWGIMDWQARNGMDANSIVAVEINGSAGVDTGQATVRVSFPPQVLDSSRYVIVADDVGDSFVSMLRVAGERMRHRMHMKDKELNDVDTVANEIKSLKEIIQKETPDEVDIWKDPRFAPLYRKAVSYLRTEHVVVAPFISKNKQFLDVLRKEYENHAGEEWSYMQREILKDQTEMDASKWITGGAGQGVWDGVRLFDIGKKLSDLYDYLPESLREVIDKEECGENVLVRLIARIPELLGLNGGIEGEKKLMKILGPEFKKIMEEQMNIEAE